MKNLTAILTILLFISLGMTLFSCSHQDTWQKEGSKPDSYYMGIDKDFNRKGRNVNTIKSIDEKIEGFGTMVQTCQIDKYRGKRVRMTGYIKTKDVNKWAGLWFRADKGDSPISFDNMHDGKTDRSIKGTNDWSKYEIVLDIPANSSALYYGALLSGTGQVWFDEIKFKIVNNDIPTTGILRYSKTMFKGGNKPDSYYMGIDKDITRNGQSVNTIKSIDEKIDGFGTMMQTCQIDKYLGKRVRMTGYIKTKDVNDWAGFWFRADKGISSLSFDNMHDSKIDRSIKGTNDWSKYEIVLDIPANSSDLYYGVLLTGTGQLWYDEINFEIVSNDIPTTGLVL
jgi:hypothetical protein